MITRISVIGIAVITAALIILLSAFNGIETMIDQLYSEFDTDITIRSSVGRTFNENRIDENKLLAISGVANVSRAVEEVVILKHEKKWVNADMYGVAPSFLDQTNMSEHMVDGIPLLRSDDGDFALVGATLLDKLEGFIPKNVGHETLICYVPKRKLKLGVGKNPFKTQMVKLSGRVNFNREVNAQSFIVPIDLAKELMDYDNQISAIYINVTEDQDKNEVKERIKTELGEGFVVKTNYEKNELIYKTSKSEKIIVLIILLFIFILAAFNLVASLTMLFVEKVDNIRTILSFGATRSTVFRIFFFEGLLIAGKGILIGAIIGYAIAFAQIYFGLIVMPNSAGEPFPMNVSWADGVLILSLVSLLSMVFSYLPVKYLIKRNL